MVLKRIEDLETEKQNLFLDIKSTVKTLKEYQVPMSNWKVR